MIKASIYCCWLCSLVFALSTQLDGQELLNPELRNSVLQFWYEPLQSEVGYTESERSALAALKADWNAPLLEVIGLQQSSEGTDAVLAVLEMQSKAAMDTLISIKAVSPEKYAKGIQFLNRRYLGGQSAREGVDHDPSFLIGKKLSSFLELLDSQKRKLGEFQETFRRDLERIEKDFHQELTKIWQGHYKRVRVGLDRESRDKFVRLVGEPALDLFAFDTTVARLTGIEVRDPEEPEFPLGNPMNPYEEGEIDFPELKTDDPETGMDGVTMKLLASKLMQDEMEFGSARRAEFIDILSRVPFLKLNTRQPVIRLVALLDENAPLPELIDSFLASAEQKRVLELELQFRLRHWESFGLQDSRMSKAVGLSDEERLQVREDIDRLKDELAQLHKTWTAKGKELAAGYRSDVVAVLSEKQRQRYESLVGSE